MLLKQAIDLNLRLMRWRLWPNLNLPAVSATKCLLLGAGTLGCGVARALLGWGVSHITFVDNGRVTYSNPARQCLYEFDDCKERRFKAEAAAAALKRICPYMYAQGVVMSLPMPGHPMSLPSATTATVEVKTESGRARDSEELVPAGTPSDPVSTLEQLVLQHDCIFSLLDSREGRWLPTVLCRRYGKMMITGALGFESYLIMHHGTYGTYSPLAAAGAAGPAAASPACSGGLRNANGSSSSSGCYFCSDIVGTRNSQRDRSLDQQVCVVW